MRFKILCPTWLLWTLLFAPWIATGLALSVFGARSVTDIPTALVDSHPSSQSRQITRALDASPQLQVQVYPDLNLAHRALEQGKVRVLIALPQNLDPSLRSGQKVPISVIRDADNLAISNQAYAAIQGVINLQNAQWSGRRLLQVQSYTQNSQNTPKTFAISPHLAKGLAAPLRLDSRSLDNPSFDYLAYLGPALLPMFWQLALMLAGAAAAGATRRTAKTSLEQKIQAIQSGIHDPANLWNGLGNSLKQGSATSTLLFWWIWSGICGLFALGLLWPMWGATVFGPAWSAHPGLDLRPGFWLLWQVLAAASLSFGFGLGRLVATPIKTTQLLLALNSPAFLLSGATFPGWAMPEFLERLAVLFPYSLYFATSKSWEQGSWNGTALTGLSLWFICGLLLVLWAQAKSKRHNYNTPTWEVESLWGNSRIEIQRLVRIPSLRLLFWIAAPAYLIIYSLIFSLKDEGPLPLAIVDLQNTQASRSFVQKVDAHPLIQTQNLPLHQATTALSTGEVRGVLIWDASGDREAQISGNQTLVLWVRSERFLPAGDLRRALLEIVIHHNIEARTALFVKLGLPLQQAAEWAEPLSLQDHPRLNPAENYGDFILPGLGLLLLHQILWIGLSVAGAGERKGHLGRAWIWGLWFWIWSLLWIRWGLDFWQVPLQSHFAPSAVVLLLCFWTLTALATWTSTLFRNGQQAMAILAFSSYPIFFLSAYNWPHWLIPPGLQEFSQLLPLKPTFEALRLCLRGGGTWADIQGPLLHLLLLACFYTCLAAIACRFKTSPRSSVVP
jgi:ABC-2 type transport system permease protein